ncbi:MAG: DUF1553 domain-containing protein [Planctomycetaceae bacterium]
MAAWQNHYKFVREDRPMLFRLLSLCFCLGVVATVVHASDDTEAGVSAAGVAFFESKVRPVLVEHCYECHSAESGASEGELLLDTRAGIRRGGVRGPAVVPGDPTSSWLLTSVAHTDADLKMPPKRDRLPPAAIADLTKWIEMGAPDPRTDAPLDGVKTWEKADRKFWAYQLPRIHDRPQVIDAAWPLQPIDAFVLAQLEKNGFSPSPDATPPVLLRRLHFDLVGLPPEPGDLSRFLDRIKTVGLDEALAAEVDELLAAPQFGERWGRHWLDVARFAESSGTEANITFPYAWRYRDYVIDCINADLPFDRFLSEQIAGDLHPYQSDQERARLLIATGFLALGPKNLDATDEAQFRADVIDEQIDTVSRAVLANSIACARCHDHKFDPFSMEDYYALAGIFASTKTFFGTAVSPSNRIGGDPLQLPQVPGQKILHDSLEPKQLEKLKAQLATLRAEQAEMDEAMKAIFSGKQPKKKFTLQDALRVYWQSGGLEGQLEKVSDTGQALPLTMGVLDAKVTDTPIHERGDIKKPGRIIPRAFPQALRLGESGPMPSDQSGRMELAQWLTHPQHPLTSRVIVNRVWHHLFGAGMVASVDNFGSSGELPSHPELLDTLAVQFMQNGWSIKHLVQQIVLSRAYRQASTYREDAFHLDPENRLLWRVSKRRLEAECIRDAMLAASGDLDLKRPDGSLVGRVIGDRPISLIGLDKRLPQDLDGSRHRSVYLPVIRDRLPDVLDIFDFAEPSLVTGNRETTNVPIQALYMLNSPFVRERAEKFASRLNAQCDSTEQIVRDAFLRCFSREPDPDEMQRSLRFLADNQRDDNAEGRAVPPELINFCQAMLCTAEFRNLD